MTSTRPQYRVRIFPSTVSYSIYNGYIKKVDILDLQQHEKVDVLYFVPCCPGSCISQGETDGTEGSMIG